MERRPTFFRYGMAVGSTALALLVTWVLRPLPPPLPGLLMLLTVLGSTVYGGLGPGLLATTCAFLMLSALIVPPTYVQIVPLTQGVRLGVFAVLACTGSVLLALARRLTARLHRVNAELEARVAERTATLTQAHTALAASETRYRELFENATDIIYTHDLQGFFTSVNKAAERLSGYTRAEALQMHIAQVVVSEQLALANQVTARQLAGETVPPYELEILTKECRRVPLEVHTRLLRHAGHPIGIQGIARDISERKRGEESLRHATEAAQAANRAKSEFLATMSHELRTPLSVIMGYTDLLLEETFGMLSDEQAHPLRRIYASARELLDLITAVLDMSRLEAGRLPMEVKAVELPALLEELKAETQGVQERSALDFVWQVEKQLPLLYTDAGKLKIVLKNLIGNAVKFTTEGRITVAVQGYRQGVEITVSDTGSGIPAEALGLIFEPFQQAESAMTRSQGGTGLGLYIVKRLLELLGGTVVVESEVGRGSTFRVWVPRESPASSEVSSETVH